MKEFIQVLKRFIPPYKKYLVLTVLFNILSALLNNAGTDDGFTARVLHVDLNGLRLYCAHKHEEGKDKRRSDTL